MSRTDYPIVAAFLAAVFLLGYAFGLQAGRAMEIDACDIYQALPVDADG